MRPTQPDFSDELLANRLPEIISLENDERGTSYDSVADFAIARRLGVPQTRVAEALRRLAARGDVELRIRTNSRGDEFLVARPSHQGVSTTDLPTPIYAGPPVDEAAIGAALPVLDALEDIEQGLINAGIYETFVEPDAVAERASLPLAVVLEQLNVLERDFQVIWPAKDRVRSRIAEICRLLKGVKQRFSPDDHLDAPHLIRSLKVDFRSRTRQRRSVPLKQPLSVLQAEFSGRRAHIAQSITALADAMEATFDGPMYLTRVQEAALYDLGAAYLRREAKQNSYVITGDTGSGKTEAFALPLFLGAIEDALSGARGTKVILVYPRIRLAVNQAQRLTRYLAALERVSGSFPTLSLGIQYGHTPADPNALTNQRQRGRGAPFDGFLCPECETGELALVGASHEPRLRLECVSDTCSWSYGQFAATREAIRKEPPDILITTTESLHRWLMEPNSSTVFGLAPETGWVPPRAIVFDEIHLYENIHGAQITRLTRRLKHRIEAAMRLWAKQAHDLAWTSPMLIGMSATIGDPAAFWQKFTGQRPQVYSPVVTDFDDARAGRDYYLFLRPESESRGRRVSTASATIQALMVLMRNMRKRQTNTGPKHRGLVFVESIDKLKRLHSDYRDAEEVRQLWQLRIPHIESGNPQTVQDPRPSDLPGFADAEVWYFDAQDPAQFAEGRRYRGAPPAALVVAPQTVYSGADDLDNVLARSDLLFATTSLEVGFDDSALQLVFQHRAPRNAASFVQKKGRGGREAGDRSIMAVMLSAESYLDAFYYQNHRLLVDPEDYVPALNEDNYFVQRGHGIAAALDAATFTQATSGRMTSSWYGRDTVQLHRQLDEDRRRANRAMSEAYFATTSRDFRRREPNLDAVWADFVDTVRGPVQPQEGIAGASSWLPTNLFSSVNLPLVAVERADGREVTLDVNLAASELAPGNVTRRFGAHDLFWTAPVPVNGAVAFVKERRGEHGFESTRSIDIAQIVPRFADQLPNSVRRLYPAGFPERLFRPERLFLARFGNHPGMGRRTLVDWWYCPSCDRTAKPSSRANREIRCQTCEESLVQLGPKTAGRLMTFPIVGRPVPPLEPVPAPGVLSMLFRDVEVFAGYSSRYGVESYLSFVNLIFGSEVTYRAERGDAWTRLYTMRTPVAAGASPILYGFSVHAEGIGMEFHEGFEDIVATAGVSLIASEKGWLRRGQLIAAMLSDGPAMDDPFAQAALADFAATAVAMVPEGQSWRDSAVRHEALRRAVPLWLHAQRFGREQFQRFETLLDSEAWVEFVTQTLVDLDDSGVVAAFRADVAAHSLEHALRSMFTVVGGVSEAEVAGTVELRTLGTGRPRAISIVERGEWGNGATRAVHDLLRADNASERSWRHLWRAAATCPVGDEEDFLRWLLRERTELLRRARAELIAEGASAHASLIPRHYVAEAVGYPYEVDSHVAALSRLVLGTESLGGESLAQLDLEV